MDWNLVWKHCVDVNSGLRLKLSSLVSANDWSKKWNDPFQYFVETKDWDQTAQLRSQYRVHINQSHAPHITAHYIMSSLMSWVQTKNDFTFWLIFGLSPNFGLSESLSERLIQKQKWPNVWNDNFTTYFGQILSLQLISMKKLIKPQ